MIKCENCEFNINGLCQRFPPAFAVTPIGRKWAFPMVGAFEGFQGCGEGRMADVVEIPSKFLGSERPSTMEAAIEKTREIGAALAANQGKPIETKPKRSRRKK